MFYTELSDRFYETTKLLQRCQGIFSKARRTLTSPPQFRIARLSGPEGFTTAALFDENSCNRIVVYKKGAVIPAYNCKRRYPDAGNTPTADWKPSPLLIKGNSPCKLTTNKKQFLPDWCYVTDPLEQYILDRRPRGVSLQQLDFATFYFVRQCELSLKHILNGTVGYRFNSEDSKKCPGRFYCRIRTEQVQTVCRNDAVIPDICLERRSISTESYCKD